MKTRTTTHDIRGATQKVLEGFVERLFPVYKACYPLATTELLRHALYDTGADVNNLRIFHDQSGDPIGYFALFFRRSMKIAGKNYAVFRTDTAMLPEFRGMFPISVDFARMSTLFILTHPFTPAIYAGAGSLPGYHFVVRNSYIAYPSPWRPTPPEYQRVMVEVGKMFFSDEPGAFLTDNPLVIGNTLLDAPGEQKEWIQKNRALYPDLTEYYLGLTGGKTDRFVLYLVPGSPQNLLMTSVDDIIKRTRRNLRRLSSRTKKT